MSQGLTARRSLRLLLLLLLLSSRFSREEADGKILRSFPLLFFSFRASVALFRPFHAVNIIVR